MPHDLERIGPVRAKIARWLREHPNRPSRSYTPRSRVAGNGLPSRAFAFLLPWTRQEYPGRWAGVCSALGNRYSHHTLIAWAKGAAPLNADAAASLSALIRAQILTGQALLAELERYQATAIAGRKPLRGFCEVKVRDGAGSTPRDARGRSSRNRPKQKRPG